jgi:hypothetical protein
VAAEQQINDMKSLQGGIIKDAMAVLQVRDKLYSAA